MKNKALLVKEASYVIKPINNTRSLFLILSPFLTIFLLLKLHVKNLHVMMKKLVKLYFKQQFQFQFQTMSKKKKNQFKRDPKCGQQLVPKAVECSSKGSA